MLKTVLVVNDSAAECAVLKEILKDEYGVETVSEIDEMFEYISKGEKTISAIVLDLIISGADGFEVLRKSRENPLCRKIPIIATAELSDGKNQIKAMSLGANGYIVKPFNGKLLLYTIKNAISLCENSAHINSICLDGEHRNTDAKEKENETSEQLRFINDSAHDILAEPDSEKAINKTLDNMRKYFDGDRAYIFELDKEKKVKKNIYEVCSEEAESKITALWDEPYDILPKWFEAFRKNDFISIEDVSAIGDSEAELRENLLRRNINSLIIVLIKTNGVLKGYSRIDNPKKGLEHIDRLRALADYIAMLLNRRDLENKVESENSAILQLMNDTPGGFVKMKMTPKGIFVPVYANDGMEKLFGMSHKELQKIYGDNVLDGVHPDDREALIEAEKKMVFNGSNEGARFRAKNGNGEYFWISLYGRTIIGDDGVTYMNVYYSDVTKQVSEEERQRELLDNLPCGAGLYNFDGKTLSVVHFNKRFLDMVGRGQDYIGNSLVINAIHTDDRQKVFYGNTKESQQSIGR